MSHSLFFKQAAVLGMIAGIGLYGAVAVASPLDTPAPAQQQDVPSDLPDLKKPAAAGKDDPLAWGTAPVGVAPAAPAPVIAPTPVVAPARAPAPVVEAAPLMPTIEKKAPPVAVAPVVNDAAPDKVEALQRRVTTLEDEVAALKATAAAKSAAPEKEKVPGLERPLAAKIKPVHVKKKKASAKAASAVHAHWELKGAKPGTAWIGEKGSTTLRTVTVGDTVPGLGRITAIARDSFGLWTVNGTQGRLSQ